MRRLVAIALLGMVAAPAACAAPSMPGTTLGTYKVTAQAETNVCGLTAPNPWNFDVELSQDGTTLYWSWMDGSPYLSGPVASQAATLLASEQVNVDGTADGGLGPCTLERDDQLLLTLATGSTPASFTGSISYAITPVAGSNCSDQLATVGGQYAVLPCTITYSMTSTRQ
jgi:ABC-type glycerol-3-phosphate transport system substrate-binding protein